MNQSRDLRPRLVLVASTVFLVVFPAIPAWAHEVGLSRGEYAAVGATVTAQLTFARRDVLTLVAGLDADHDGTLTAAEIAEGQESMNGALAGRIRCAATTWPVPASSTRRGSRRTTG